MVTETEAMLINEAVKGNAGALTLLFQWYQPRLYTNALRIAGNTPFAKDAVQDTFFSAFTQISSLRDPLMFYPWLRKILLNHCFQLLRKEKSMLKCHKNFPNKTYIEESIEQRLENSTVSYPLYEALSHLSGELRSCVLLKYFSCFESYKEIALILGIPIGTVRSRLAAAREKLSVHFSHMEDKGGQPFAEAAQWSAYYFKIWETAYDGPLSSNEFIKHLHPNLKVFCANHNSVATKQLIVSEFENDFLYGSRFYARNVSSCGNISVIEGININSIEYPDRCAPSTVFVLFRNNNLMVDTCNIYDSPRCV